MCVMLTDFLLSARCFDYGYLSVGYEQVGMKVDVLGQYATS